MTETEPPRTKTETTGTSSGNSYSGFAPIRPLGRFAIPVSGFALIDPIFVKPSKTQVKRGEILVERWPATSPAPLAPADGRIACLGVAKLTARLTVPAILFEPDSAAPVPEAAPAARVDAIPEMLRKMAEMDLAAGIERLRQHGVWADRWTAPDLLGQLRAAHEKPIDTLLCSVLDESPDLLLHHELAEKYPVELIAGVLALGKLTQAKEILTVLAAFGDVAAWDALRRASDETSIKLVPLHDHYPQAHPTLLIHELTGKHSRPVKSPVESGLLVLDAAAAIAVGRCFLSDTPMLTVPVGFRERLHDRTHWLDVPIGMPWSQVLAQLSIPEATVDLRAGNPLREVRLTADCVASGAEHCVMASPHERFLNANACIRCAWCVEGCPVQIQPAGLLEAAQQDDPLLGDAYGLDACVECGICSYVCPSHLSILAGIRALRGHVECAASVRQAIVKMTTFEIRNPKSDVRNPKQIQNGKTQIPNKKLPFGFLGLSFPVIFDFVFRISDFSAIHLQICECRLRPPYFPSAMTTTALPRPAELTSLPHSGLSVTEFYSMHFMAALIPLTAGLLLYGWRAALAIVLVMTGAAAGIAVWRRIGPRGQQLSFPHGLWLAMLLALMLPAHLAADQLPGTLVVPWYLLPAAGLVLAMFMWLLGGLGAGRVHPVLVTYLLIAALFVELLIPHWVLQRNHLLLGDILHGSSVESRQNETEPWTRRWKLVGQDSEQMSPASEALSRYTRGREKPPRGWQPIQNLLRDDLPPLEDLIVGGHPGPIGAGSAIAVIIGGLFLLYRGLIDFRIPLIIFLVEYACLLILPTPVILTTEPNWHWIISRQADVGWATGITFANYEIMAGPSLFMAFFIATAPSIRPMSRRARVIYASIAGAGAAALQLYLGVSVGPYIALLLASLLTPVLDVWFRPRPLV